MSAEKESKESCFVIMPISDVDGYPEGHFMKVYNDLFQPAIEAAGYKAIRVDENKICDSIIEKIFDAIQNCSMCLCDLSSRNPNVLYELGLRQAYDKPVVLVQDKKTQKIFDVSGISTVHYRWERFYDEVIADRQKITDAIVATKEEKDGYSSIIKMVNVQKALVVPDNMSEESKIEIILSSIQRDIRGLKSTNNIENNDDITDYYNMIKCNERDNFFKGNAADKFFYDLIKFKELYINENNDIEFLSEYRQRIIRLRTIYNKMNYKEKEAIALKCELDEVNKRICECKNTNIAFN